MEKYLNESQLIALRQNGLISSNEVAIEIGDLLVAEDVLTKARRIIEKNDTISESSNNKRLLKG